MISVLGCDDRRSRAALIGVFDRGNVEFLRRHLDELAGDVLLECGHLDGIDDSAATALLDFRRSRLVSGAQVLFRGIGPGCRRILAQRAMQATGEGAGLSRSSAPNAPWPRECRAI